MKTHYTLEAHLRKLSKHDDTAQHLRSIFDLQKQKMEKHLLSVVTTFPTYSSHDTAHCSRIIMAMERILDKPIIKQLSSTDTFLLLICAYMHDVGMLYTDKEVRSIWGTNDFKLFLDSCKERNSELSDAVSKIYEPFPTNRGSEWPLEVRQSITLLLMEYFRPKHGKRIETVTDLTRNRTAQLLRIEDSYLPDRIIRLINTICRLHNDKFSELLTVIPFEDSFGRDSFHPRMVAYMLRLCDLCDTDNDRFNKIGIYTFGNLSDSNLPHFFKHKSVETLHISPTSIEVSANITYDKIEYSCRNEWMSDEKDEKKQNKRIDRVFRQTVREHINWKRWMEQEIQNGRLNYNKIFPANWGFSLPEIKYIIKIDGKESASTSENLRFLFSQEKAFDLIESISIYQNDSMIFLRELIQNSIDATKIQLWRFITENNKELDHNEILTPFDVEEHYHGIFSKFPIEINLEYNSETQCAEFSIVDKGIGISVEELKSNILITGTSWNDRERYKSELEKMPDWLKPTGAFGIGMHSVFYVTDEINILTKSNMEELPNQIVLCSGKKDGFAFCRKIKQLIPRGTKISFEFKITQNEMEAFVDTSCPVFLRNEEESIIAAARDTIEKWLVTPLFPVFFNQQLVVDSITKQYDFRQLCNQTVRNRIPGRQNAEYDSDNYDFAFSNNYQSVIIWDRKNECLMHFSIGEGAGSSTSFHAKGIFITQDNSWDIEENDSIVSSTLDIDLFDALACDTKLVMDAARTSIKKQYLVHCNNLVSKAEQQCINLYLQLLDTIIHNEGYTNLRQSISMAARLFKKKSNRTNSIWDVSEDLFCKFFSDCQMSANAKQRIILQFCFMIVDEISFVTNRRVLREKKDISTIKKLVHSTSYFWLSILDDALQSYSHYVETGERELSSYASIYLSRFHYLIDYYLCYLLRINDDYAMSRKLRTEFSQRASNYMNFIARNIDCVYLETEEEYGVREYLNSDSLIPIAVETRCDDVCSDYSAYANEQLFMLNATWYRFVIKLATSRYIESQLYKRIWTAILSDCFYGEIFVDKNKRIKHFFELDSISVVLNGFTHPIYDIEKYPVRRIKIKDSLFCITYSISRELSTVEMSEVVKQKLFRAFWEEVKDSNEYQEYIPLIAPSCFGLLAVFPNQIDLSYCRIKVSRSDTTFINSLLIPTWDYSCNIYSFMKDYTKRDLKDDCIKNIILSPKFLNVTKFIYDKKHSEDESADIEKIKTEYTKLLEELLDAYYDYILE